MTEFTRTFHPVGQGAFYSETFRVNADTQNVTEYRVVYDCGSKKGKDWLKSRIASSFPNNNVDILFLSHFHDDHYKGIENLQPRIIILPLLDEWDKVIFWIGRNLNKSRIDVEYGAKLKEQFPNSRFIYIRPLDEDTRRSEEPIGIETIIDSQDLNNSDSRFDIQLPSGSILKSNSTPDWIYIPVNPKLDKSVSDLFHVLLEENGIDEDELKKLDKNFFSRNKKTLAKIYNKLGNPNEFSMVVYSGPNPYLPQNRHRSIEIDSIYMGNAKRICTCYDPIGPWCYRHCPDFVLNRRRIHRLKAGCLYLGDINLSDKTNPDSPLLQKIYSFLPIDSIHDINTIQVPHHGSIDNYHSSLTSYYNWIAGKWEEWDRDIMYVISVGESNTYGHPSAWVMMDLLNKDKVIILVTESAASSFMEKTDWTD